MNASSGSGSARGSRAVAAGVIERWLRTGLFPDRLMAPGTADRAFVMEVVYGVARWRRMLEWVVSQTAGRKPDAVTLSFLMVGLYQLLHMEGVRPHAAVHETVEALKNRRGQEAAGFLNAVLRNVQRGAARLRHRLERESPGVRLSHPDRLVAAWTARYGAERTAALCRWNNTRPSVTLCPNPCSPAGQNLEQKLRASAVDVEPHPFRPEAFLVLPRGIRVTAVPGYAQGAFSIQDPSTLVAVELLDPQPGHLVLDACAAPGGKTALLAERMQDRGRVVAMDLFEPRLHTLRQNIQRLGLRSVRTALGNAADERDLASILHADAPDRILLDVPCTNTGVLRRRPDARWRFATDMLDNTVRVQRRILDGAAHVLAPGGRLVYSTCSLQPEENEHLVRSWLDANPGWTLEEEAALFPPDTGTDGIYAAALRRALS